MIAKSIEKDKIQSLWQEDNTKYKHCLTPLYTVVPSYNSDELMPYLVNNQIKEARYNNNKKIKHTILVQSKSLTT